MCYASPVVCSCWLTLMWVQVHLGFTGEGSSIVVSWMSKNDPPYGVHVSLQALQPGVGVPLPPYRPHGVHVSLQALQPGVGAPLQALVPPATQAQGKARPRPSAQGAPRHN